MEFGTFGETVEEARLLRKIKILLLDIDGVMTDGTILRMESGSEVRRFSVIDGHGIFLLIAAGIKVGCVSREDSIITRGRMEKLGMEEIHLGISNKRECVLEIRERLSLKDGEVAFVGDDLPDLEAFMASDLTFSPCSAHPVVRDKADVVCKNSGGGGAVREVCEMILGAKEKI